MLEKCFTCNVKTIKYKCPKCLGYYCSANCYKPHKDNKCNKKIEEDIVQHEKIRRIPMPFKTEDTVGHEKLELLRQSNGLKNLLYNQHLRNFLKEIDDAPNAWKTISCAMQEPLFVEFADECLKVIEPSSDSEA